MKKITFLLAAFLVAVTCATAQINNPKDVNGYYIVKWDCENDTWATSNDFEVDEAFTFAIDVTGTPLEEWLRQPSTVAGATRSIAVNRWTGFGAFVDDMNRLKPIKGNIYGTTWCFSQVGGDFDLASATQADAITYFQMSAFGFAYTPEQPGAEWYASAIEGIDAVDGIAFTSAPYTGTKTSIEFYADEYEGFWPYVLGGYAPSCAVIPSAGGGSSISSVTTDSPVIGYEYYNLQGAKLAKQPESGLYIEKALKANGTFAVTKNLR